MVTSRPPPGGTMRGPSEAGESEPMAEMLQRHHRGPEAARQSYALRACHVRCSRGSKPALASGSQVAAAGNRWLLMAVRGHLGGTPVMRRPGPARPWSWCAAPLPHRTDCCRSIRWREGVKGGFACALTRHFQGRGPISVGAGVSPSPSAAMWPKFPLGCPFGDAGGRLRLARRNEPRRRSARGQRVGRKVGQYQRASIGVPHAGCRGACAGSACPDPQYARRRSAPASSLPSAVSW